MNENASKPVINVTGARDSSGVPLKRRQVYSNCPPVVYGYIVPVQEAPARYAIQVGDSFTPLDAPYTATGFKTLLAATRAILAHYPNR